MRAVDVRAIVCETQTTNVAAIDLYRGVGFEMDGLDLSCYANEDVARGEVALFMKRKLTARRPRKRPESAASGHTSE